LSEQLRRDFSIDLTLTTKDTASFYVELRDGTHTVSNVGTGIILFDPSDLINQNYEVDVLRNPHNWTDPELTKLIEAQGRELDPAKRKEIFEDIVDILRQGEGHVVPYLWRTATQVLDYRIRNRHAPQTVQLVNKMEHIWFDLDAKIPAGTGYIP
jgi:ABC-type transport system substrate-binding protein